MGSKRGPMSPPRSAARSGRLLPCAPSAIMWRIDMGVVVDERGAQRGHASDDADDADFVQRALRGRLVDVGKTIDDPDVSKSDDDEVHPCATFLRRMPARKLVRCATDEGESGADTDRIGLHRLVANVIEWRTDRVLVHRLDRLTRRAADWAEIDGIFRAHDVAICVVDGGIHGASDAITRFCLTVLAVFAELERDMIGERLH